MTQGPNAERSEQEAKLFADAPAMMDMLEQLVLEFGNLNPDFPIAPGKMNELKLLIERASLLKEKHAKIRKAKG